MKVTFLIGNGFDIGMGMKSKFSDYFPIYIEQSQNKKTSLKELSNHIENNQENWSYFERQLGCYTDEFIPETKKLFIEQVKDFEKGFINYLKNQESELSFDNGQRIARTMIDALMSYYSDDNLPRQSSKDIEKIYDKYKMENITYEFINFNYTSVLEKALNTIPQKIVSKRNGSNTEYIDKIGSIIYVHGRSNRYPIMGVNDASQISNKELANDDKFARYIVKPVLNQRLRQNNDIDADNLIAESTIICIYGMSLGETDKYWWNKVLVWLYNNPNRQLVIFDYDEYYTMSTQFERIEKEDSILDKLTEYNTNSIVNVEKLRSRIHIAVHKNIFQINLRREKVNESDVLKEEISTMSEIAKLTEQHRDEIELAHKYVDEAKAQRLTEELALLKK